MSFQKRREKHKTKRELKGKKDDYTFGDFFLDVFFYIPEIILLPFRLLWYGVRLMLRIFDWI
jgi:hypothetical protein